MVVSTQSGSISRDGQCESSTTGTTKVVDMCYPACESVHIKDPLLLIEKEQPK